MLDFTEFQIIETAEAILTGIVFFIFMIYMYLRSVIIGALLLSVVVGLLYWLKTKRIKHLVQIPGFTILAVLLPPVSLLVLLFMYSIAETVDGLSRRIIPYAGKVEFTRVVDGPIASSDSSEYREDVLVKNPPLDYPEKGKTMIAYFDSARLSIDDLSKMPGKTSYEMNFYKSTSLTKGCFVEKKPGACGEKTHYLGSIWMSRCKNDTAKWRINISENEGLTTLFNECDSDMYWYESSKSKRLIKYYAELRGENIADGNVETKDKPIAPDEPVDIDPLDMVFVEGGTFTMGCNEARGDDCHYGARTNRVTISDFSIGRYEVTQKLWTDVVGGNPSEFKGDGLPVEMVSWNDAQEFIRKLNAKTGKNYRLPTEAEWEFAARGGNKSREYNYSGGNTLDDVAWYEDNSGGKTHHVGIKRANELGIHDMSGNVFEWVSDWNGRYDSWQVTDPAGPASGINRMYRGGGWSRSARGCRVFYRLDGWQEGRGNALGFRLALGPALAAYVPDAKAAAAPKPADINIDMVRVRGGTFTMGCDNPIEHSDCEENRTPPHKVKVSNFSIGRHKVSQELWQDVMGADHCRFGLISWDDTQMFIQKLNARTGKNYRLPTEAEWEYAARGGNKSFIGAITGMGGLVDMYNDMRRAVASLFPFGAFMFGPNWESANELGIYGMGRGFEFVNDRYGDYSAERQINPAGPSTGIDRVMRIGGWHSRYAGRHDSGPSSGSDYSFRLVIGPEPNTPAPDLPPSISPFKNKCDPDP
jgi:formylglycine-generating enzyme required for sulfatase activity